ncbi:virion structural protein [Vibrio phage C-ZP2022]|nr:virion structural protein [Vibrio phage C-ZP2022]
MTKAKEALVSLATHLETSPGSIFELSLDMLDEAYNGEIDIVDATSPMVSLLATTATINAGSMLRMESLSRREYPALAQTWDDLFPHMSSDDHLDRFAKPVEDTVIYLGFSASELRDAAVADTESGMKRLTIPRDSSFSVVGVSFYTGYPIDIYMMDDGQFTCRWDDSIPNPLRSLATNHIPTKTLYTPAGEVLVLTVPMIQLAATSSSQPASVSSGFKITQQFDDYFYAARIYMRSASGWTEIKTTFDEQVYNPSEPTAIIKVEENLIHIRLPEIYFTQKMNGSTVRVDIFTTKGVLNMNLAEYASDVWSGEFIDFGMESGRFIDPVLNLTIRSVESLDKTIGGRSGLSFDEVKQRVIFGHGDKEKALSFDELKTELAKEQLGVERQKDTIGNRTFVATKKLEIPDKYGLSTGTGTASAEVTLDLARDDINNHLVRNGDLSTLKPSALFKKSVGSIALLSDQETISFENLSIYNKADYLNNEEYFYTPYHYVVDESSSMNALRAYYLRTPVVNAVNVIQQNSSAGFTISTSNSQILYDETAQTYSLSVIAETPNMGERTIAVLNFTDPVTNQKWDIVGMPTYIDSDRTRYDFVFGSMVDFDGQHDFTVNGWTGTGNPRFSLRDHQLDLVYLNTSSSNTTSFDSVLAKNALTGTYTAIAHETLDITFGEYLERLYTPMRKIITPPTYQTWTYDVPMVYPTTEFEMGIEGPVISEVKPGEWDFVVKHYQGDQVVIDGELQWEARKGERVVNSEGNFIELKPSGTAFKCRLAMVDASYRFASTSEIVAYEKEIPSTVTATLRGPIDRIANALFEETNLFFEPVSDKVDARARLDSGRESTIPTALSFSFRVRLTDSAYQNPNIRKRLRDSLTTLLLDQLDSSEFYLSELYAVMAKLSPENIRAIEIDSPIPSADMAILLEENARFTLATKALVLANGELDIVDDIDIEWTK